jgi:hypothetical protein
MAATIPADRLVRLSLAPIHDDLPTFMSLPQDVAARYRPLSMAIFVQAHDG